MITISLCMIVKNEEKVLERCLDRIAPLMDEIIIVDTGSTDKTKEIARKYTNNIYDFVWIDDFAAARNFSFSRATMEYIYAADADEVIDPESIALFHQLKNTLLPEIDIVQMLYCNQLELGTTYNFDEEYRPKLYKRLRTFHWQDPLHESVALTPIIYDSDIKIQHKPLTLHAKRDFRIFEKMIEKRNPFSSKLHTMYAKELFIGGSEPDFLQSEEFFLSSVINESSSLDQIKEASCVLARIYRIKQDTKHFFQYCLKDITTDACSEMCYEIGSFFMTEKDYDEAIVWFYNAKFETECILCAKYGHELALEGLIACYRELGLEEQRRKYEAMLNSTN